MSIALIVVSQVDIEFLSLKITFVLANSVDHDKKPLLVTFHLGLHCLPKYPFTGVQALTISRQIFSSFDPKHIWIKGAYCKKK